MKRIMHGLAMHSLVGALLAAAVTFGAPPASAETRGTAAPAVQAASAAPGSVARGPARRGYVAVTADGIRVGVVDRVLPRQNGITTVIITMDQRIPTAVRKFSVPVVRHMRGDGLVLLDWSERELLRKLHGQSGI